MRFVTFRVRGTAAARVGAMREDGSIADLSAHWPSLRGLLSDPEWASTAPRAVVRAPDVAVERVELLPPIPDAGKVLCVGINYDDHGRETTRERPAHPAFFVRFPASLVGHRGTILRPPESERLDWEGELALVIGRRIRRATDDATAVGAIAGYAAFLDNAVRDWQRHSTQATAGKNFDRSGAFGPCLVTSDEAGDPGDMELRTTLNGETVQQGRTSAMVFDVAQLVRYASTFCTLEPGDVIATGTPAGVGAGRVPPRWLRPGDALSVTISRLGTLSVIVAEETVP